MLHLRELQVLRRVRVVERYRGLWENWVITKTAFPSSQCDVSCVRLVGLRVTLHQGEEGGLKLAKRSLFTFRAMSRL